MAQVATTYRLRGSLPQYIQYPIEGAATGAETVEATIYDSDSGDPQVTAGSIDIIRPDGSLMVDDQAITITGDNALSYAWTVTAADENLSSEYQIRWRCTIYPGTEVVQFIQRAFVVRQKLWPVLTAADILMRHPEITQSFPSGPESQINAAWEMIQRRIIGQGKFPWLILDPGSLYEPHMMLCLSIVFRLMSTYATGAGRYAELATLYDEKWEKAWGDLQFTYDYDDTGLVGDGEKATPSESVIFLSESPSWLFGHRVD